MTNAYESYLESKVLSADPVELITIMYSAALDAVSGARVALRNGDIAQRSREITKASEILNELALALDHERGGEISKTLVELYDYMLHRLIEANTKQEEPPLVEVAGLLATMKEGWETCRASLQPAQPPALHYGGGYDVDETTEYAAVSYTA